MQFVRSVTTVDVHAAGQPWRIVMGGFPPLRGHTVEERMNRFREQGDDLRRFLLREPRGHAGMNACVWGAPDREGSDLGAWFMNSAGCRPLSGTGLMALAVAALEAGIVDGPEEAGGRTVAIDTPSETYRIRADMEKHRIRRVALTGLSAFLGPEADLPAWADMRAKLRLVHCGGWFAVVDAGSLGLRLQIDERPKLEQWGKRLHRTLREIVERDMAGEKPEGIVFTLPPTADRPFRRNVTVGENGQLDRSPGGRASGAVLASLVSRGEGGVQEPQIHEGIAGMKLTAELLRPPGRSLDGAAPLVLSGSAHVTGHHHFLCDPGDSWKTGFFLGD